MSPRRAALRLAIHLARADLRDAFAGRLRRLFFPLSPRHLAVDSELVCLLNRSEKP